MSSPETCCHWRSDDARKIRSRPGRLGARFDHIENRPGAATLPRAGNCKINGGECIVLKHNIAQCVLIYDEPAAFDPCRRAELDFSDGVVSESQLHNFLSHSNSARM